MPQRVITFEVGGYCAGGNHAGITTKFGRSRAQQRVIGDFHGSLKDFRDETDNPRDEDIDRAAQILLAVALRRADPTGRDNVKAVIQSISITLEWVNS